MDQINPKEVLAREYRLGDVLSDAWEFCQKNYRLILVLAGIVYLPINLIARIIPYPNYEPNTASVLWKTITGVNAGITSLLLALVGILVPMTLALAYKKYIDGQALDYKTLFREAFQVWPKAIVTQIILGVLLILLTLCLVVPGIIFGVYWAFAIYIVVLSGKSNMDALRYSKEIVKGHWWRVVGYTIVASVMAGIASVLVNIIFLFIPDGSFLNFIPATVSDIIMTFTLIVSIVLFLNLEHLKKSAPTPPPAPIAQK